MKFLKAFGIFLAALALIPCLFLSGYFFIKVYPYLEEINQMVAAEPIPPSELYSFALIAESKKGIARYAGKLLGWRYYPDNRPSAWFLAYTVPHLYSEQDLFKLWVRLAPCGYKLPPGLRGASQAYYGKDLSQLNRRQLAELVAAVKGPSIFRPGSERLAQRVEWLLAQEMAANKHRLPGG